MDILFVLLAAQAASFPYLNDIAKFIWRTAPLIGAELITETAMQLTENHLQELANRNNSYWERQQEILNQ